MGEEVLTAALAYAARGWPVFPVHGKVPLTTRGFHDASTDPDRIRRWWATSPRPGGVAIACGGAGLLVVDVDPRNSGLDTLEQLRKQHGDWPPGPTVRTGGGGYHLYLAAPAGAWVPSTAGPGVDLKGSGGYVVAPPSHHPSGGRYAWATARGPEVATPAAPAWLLSRPAPRGGAVYLDGGLFEPAREGQRASRLSSLVGVLERRGFHSGEIRAAAHAWAATCEPPLPDVEVELVIRSILLSRARQLVSWADGRTHLSEGPAEVGPAPGPHASPVSGYRAGGRPALRVVSGGEASSGPAQDLAAPEGERS